MFQLTIAPLWVLSSILASLSLWLVNKKVRKCWIDVDELYNLYLLRHTNGQMYVCLIASSIKIINKRNVLLCTDSSQPEWFHVEIYVYVLYVLGLWFANTAPARIIIKHICDWIWDNLASTHNYKYLEISNLIIWSIITQKGKQMLAWNLPRFYSYL